MIDPSGASDPLPAPDPPVARDPRRSIGRQGEDLALDHLRALGFEAVARNHRTRHGEIDLIVFDGRVLAFVEVKTRILRARPGPGPPPASPLEGLRARQRVRLRRLVAAWLTEVEDRPSAGEIRVDAIGIVLDSRHRLVRLDHVEGVL
jgi:putative endonuclease